jgi:hypothetical protein
MIGFTPHFLIMIHIQVKQKITILIGQQFAPAPLLNFSDDNLASLFIHMPYVILSGRMTIGSIGKKDLAARAERSLSVNAILF